MLWGGFEAVIDGWDEGLRRNQFRLFALIRTKTFFSSFFLYEAGKLPTAVQPKRAACN